MNTNNFISLFGQLSKCKTYRSWQFITSSTALLLASFPLFFDYSVNYWLVPIAGIVFFTLSLIGVDDKNIWLKLKSKDNAINGDLQNKISPVMITHFGLNNPAFTSTFKTAA